MPDVFEGARVVLAGLMNEELNVGSTLLTSAGAADVVVAHFAP